MLNENNAHSQLQDTQREQGNRGALGGTDAGKKESATRPIVRITSSRTRLLDKDNLYRGAKGLLDALRYAGAISGDSESEIDYEAAQVKVAHRAQEKTEITIEAGDAGISPGVNGRA